MRKRKKIQASNPSKKYQVNMVNQAKQDSQAIMDKAVSYNLNKQETKRTQWHNQTSTSTQKSCQMDSRPQTKAKQTDKDQNKNTKEAQIYSGLK